MRRIRKVKVDKKGKVFLQWEVEIFGQKGDRIGWDEYTMTCSDLPRPEFIDAMKALIQDVVSLCELPDKDAEDRITVRSVTWSYSDEDIQGAVISAQRKLYNSVAPMNINTPHKPYQPYNEACEDPDPDMILSEDTIARLDTLEEECQYYIDGDRAQMKLFEEETAEGAEKK